MWSIKSPEPTSTRLLVLDDLDFMMIPVIFGAGGWWPWLGFFR